MTKYLPFAVILVASLAMGAEIDARQTRQVGLKAAAAAEKLGWRVGSQAYTLRDRTLMEALDTLHALGLKYVECYPGQTIAKDMNGPDGKPMKFGVGIPAEAVNAVKKKLADTGIKVVSFGVTGVPKDEAGARKLFDFAKLFEMEQIVTESSKDIFPMLDKLAAEYKIRVALHNHPEPNIYGTPQKLLAALEGASPNIGACADVGHWARSGVNPVEGLKQAKGRIIELHFKDLNEFGVKKAHDVPWGTGTGNAKGQLEELKAQGFKGAFMMEYEHGKGDELVANMAKCVEWFGKTCEELAK